MHTLRIKYLIIIIAILAAVSALGACKSINRKAGAPPAPGAPVVVGTGNGRLSLSWKAVKGAEVYEVWYNTENNSASSVRGGEIAATDYTITGLANGRLYYVWLKAGHR